MLVELSLQRLLILLSNRAVAGRLNLEYHVPTESAGRLDRDIGKPFGDSDEGLFHQKPLDIRSLLRMAGQVPAGLRSRVRKERMDTGLRLRRIDNELRLAALLQNSGNVVHRHHPIRVAVRGHPNAEGGEIDDID